MCVIRIPVELTGIPSASLYSLYLFILSNNYSASVLSSQIKSHFLSPKEDAGYCGDEFSYVPSNNIPHALISKEDVILRQRLKYYECLGVSIVQKANFVSESPWIIPFCIYNFKSDHTKMFSYRIVAHIN